MVSLGSGNDPFGGGAQQRNLAPPTVGGSISSANTNVSSPAGGVNPGTPFAARNNQGSNIGVPYTRLCPLNNEEPLGKRSLDGTTKNMHTETQSLRATTLAFILGKRSNLQAVRGTGDRSQFQMTPTMMPGMPGTERFQALCSFEYLKLYFKEVLANQTISLSAKIEDSMKNAAHFAGCPNGKLVLSDQDTLLSTTDLAKSASITMPGSEMDQSPARYQGIFARDVGPFLHGKGIIQENLSTAGKTSIKLGTDTWDPCTRSRNTGDELAFASLYNLMLEKGMYDWQPDGIVLSKGTDDPNDAEGDAYMNARDGQLFNMRIQGPAIATSWTGDSSMETLPLDKVFVIIVADVWYDGDDTEISKAVEAFNKGGPGSYEEYSKFRDGVFSDNAKKLDDKAKIAAFQAKAKEAFEGEGDKVENTILTNFRVQLSTSSQIVNYSHMKPNAKSTVPGKRSRMGLQISTDGGEYIVGSWCIGSVMDTSASRAAFPNTGSMIGVRTAPNSAALNINVQVGYWDSDRLWRTFMNREGTVKPRYEKFTGGPTLAQNISGVIGYVYKPTGPAAEASTTPTKEAGKKKTPSKAPTTASKTPVEEDDGNASDASQQSDASTGSAGGRKGKGKSTVVEKAKAAAAAKKQKAKGTPAGVVEAGNAAAKNS